MSLIAGLTCPNKLAGVVGLSSWLLLSQAFPQMLPSPNVNKETPVFMGHGTEDQIVQTAWGKETSEFLTGMGYNVTWKTYR